MRAVRMLELSPLVTAARWSRSKPKPTIVRPGQSSGRRRKDRRFLSMMATLWPSRSRRMPSSEPTRPQPTTITCMGKQSHTGAIAVKDEKIEPMPTEAELSADRTLASGPKPLPPSVDVPESRSYRLKTRLLGQPLATERLAHERLGIPTALAVFSSDCISSSAYATEQILTRLIPVIGILAFSLVVPITVTLLVVLFFLILSYRETIKEYPTAGGAYMVTRDNFGLLPAQVAGVALLTDYVLTVAVSTAAGTAALTSVVPALTSYAVPIAVFFIAFIAYGNLRGVRESGRMFAVPTYFFIFAMIALLGIGISKLLFGHLPVETLHHAGLVKVGHGGSGLLMGATLFIVLRAFA